jgi:hypothetical protein
MVTNPEELSLAEQATLQAEEKIDNYQSHITDFFDLSKPVPSIFKNGEALRKDYFEREEKIRKRENCLDCELGFFKAHYIDILLKHVG